MPYTARILLDSLSPVGARLTTMEVRYPRFIHSEMMTHRVFSRNAASSRAVPIKKMIAAVREEPAMPIFWGKNQSGMAAREEIVGDARVRAETEWRRALDNALETAEQLSSSEVDLHKQLVNRILEPFAWITVIITATEWANFFTQRLHADAQPEGWRVRIRPRTPRNPGNVLLFGVPVARIVENGRRAEHENVSIAPASYVRDLHRD